MQIQRIQSLLLLLGCVFTAIFIFVPYGYTYVTVGEETRIFEALKPTGLIGLWIPAAIAALMQFVSIFMFRNTRLQKLVARLSMIVTLVAIGVTIYVLASGFHAENADVAISRVEWGGGGLLLIADLLAVNLAIKRICLDERLIRGIDHFHS